MSYGGQMQYPGPAPGMGAPPVRAPQPPPTQTSIQFMLDENCQLIQSIIDHHQQGISRGNSKFFYHVFLNDVFLGSGKRLRTSLLVGD